MSVDSAGKNGKRKRKAMASSRAIAVVISTNKWEMPDVC